MKFKNTKLIEAAASSMKEYSVPGLTACIIKDGTIADSIALGVKDDNNSPVTEDTLFEAASLTKSFYAVYFMRLLDRGLVSLDKPVFEQSAPEWSNDDRFKRLTPRHCLSHGSGFPNWGGRPLPMNFEPGTKYSYSGEGYYLLQHMTDTITGVNWKESVQSEFFIPWGIESGVFWTEEIGKRMSFGFGKNGNVRKIRDHADIKDRVPEPNAAWSLYSNAKIYAEFICRLMNERAGLSENSFNEMKTPSNHAAENVDWGLGWGISSGLLWHWGDNSGYKNFVIWDPKDRSGAVIFTNSDNGMNCYFDILGKIAEIDCIKDIKSFIEGAE